VREASCRAGRIEVSAEDAWSDGVDGNALFDHSTASERVSDATPALLARRRYFAQCDKTVQRSDIDDAP